MKKLVILCLCFSFSFAGTLCNHYKKEVDKDLSKIVMTPEDNHTNSARLEYEYFQIDIRSAIVECDGKEKAILIKLRDNMKEIMK